MQLSDDGNFQWDGNQWVPVEQAAAPAAPAAPMVVSPHAEMAAPVAAAPATVMVSGSSSGGGLDFTRGFSTLKYGLAALLSSILTVILILIVNGIIFYVAFDSGEGAMVMLGALLAVMFNVLAFTQVLTLVMGMGIADGLGRSGLGYVGSWKTAGTAILESAPVLVVAAILMIVGTQTEGAVMGLSYFLSFTILVLFQMGLLAFMARKIATDL